MSADLAAQSRLPELSVTVTPRMIIQGAIASRDWQPQHHDVSWAVGHAGLPGIIMNNYTQAGWISRYVTDWCGPRGRIGRMRFSMRSPICPGDEMRIAGVIRSIERDAAGFDWVDIAIEITVGSRTATTASVRLALPSEADKAAAWRCAPAAWQP